MPPCSRRDVLQQPDAKGLLKPRLSELMCQLQREILEDAVTMLAEGGRLVYSTCTWALEENEEIVRWLDACDF